MANKLEMRLVLYKGNTRTGYLPEAKDIEVVMPFGGIPTIRFSLPGLYNIDGVNAGYVNYSRQLIDKADVALEVNWNNTGWREPRNARFEITEEDREDDLYGDVSLSGQGVASDLSYGMSNATWGRDKKTGGWKYSTTSVGAIVASHLRSAQNLGYCSYIVWERPIPGGWNSTLDSNGYNWSSAAPTISREASPMDVIRSLSDSVIFFMEGNQLRLVDRSRTMLDGMSKGVKCDLVYGRDLQRIPIKRSVTDRVQRVVAYGENGVSSTATNWATAGTRGPRVRAMSEGGVKDRNELRRRAQSALTAASQVNEEARRLMDLGNAVWLPWRDFELGDVVHSEGWTQDRQKYPVVELVLRNMTIDSGPQVEVTLGQVNRSALRQIVSSIHAVSPNGFSGGSGSAAGGSIGGSGGTVTISDPKADEGPPAAPEGFTVTSVLNTSITGDAVVDLEALWAPPTYTAAGEERWRPIQAYRVQHQDLSELYPKWVSWPETTDIGQTYPSLKPGRAYAVRMQCRTEEGWSDPTATIEVWGGDDEIPPPPPGRLTAVSDKGMVIVTWDKQFSGNQPMAVDFSHLIVFQGVDIDKMETFAGATLRPGGSVIFQATPGQTLHIGGKSVDLSGNVSEMGELVTVTVRSVLDDTDLKDRLEGLDSDLGALDEAVGGMDVAAEIAAAKAEAIAAAGLDAKAKADAAEAAAKAAAAADATAKAEAAEAAAAATAAVDAKAKADAAEAAAKAAAAVDAQERADAAEAAAKAAAAADATAKAEAAEASAAATAARDAKARADAAEAAAKAAAAADATAKADAAVVKALAGSVPRVTLGNPTIARNVLSFRLGTSKTPATTSFVVWTRIPFTGPMVSIDLTGFNFSSARAEIKATFSCYCYADKGGTIYGSSYTSSGGFPVKIRAAKDENNELVLIVDALNEWEIPYLTVPEVRAGYVIPPVESFSRWAAEFRTQEEIDTLFGATIVTPSWSRDMNDSHELTQGWRTTGKTTIDGGKVTADSVTAAQIAANTITANEIATGAVTANKIAAGAVTADAILADSILAEHIGAGQVVAEAIAADAVTATAIKADAIEAQHLKAGSVVAGKLGVDAVTANNIAAGSITTAKMTVGSIDVDRISAGSFSGYEIKGAIITGGTVRTAASGARVEINSAGIKTWDANGNNTAHISGTVGSLIGFSLTGGTITGPTIRTNSGNTRLQMNSSGSQHGLVFFKNNYTAFHLAEYGGRYELRFNSVGSTQERVRLDQSGIQFWTSTGYSAGGIASGSKAYPSVNFYGGAGEFLAFENTNVSLSSGLSSTNSSITLDSRAAVVIKTNTALYDAWRFYTGTISGVSRTNFQFSAGRSNMPQTTLASNLHMDGNGIFYHTTSRGIFKLDQRLADYGDLALKLQPKTWVDAAAVSIDPEYNDRTVGLVLEDVLAAGGAHFASFNSDGVPDGLMYDRIHLAYIPVLQRHNDEIAYLTARIEALEARA